LSEVGLSPLPDLAKRRRGENLVAALVESLLVKRLEYLISHKVLHAQEFLKIPIKLKRLQLTSTQPHSREKVTRTKMFFYYTLQHYIIRFFI
jgi:hypothetical protein